MQEMAFLMLWMEIGLVTMRTRQPAVGAALRNLMAVARDSSRSRCNDVSAVATLPYYNPGWLTINLWLRESSSDNWANLALAAAQCH